MANLGLNQNFEIFKYCGLAESSFAAAPFLISMLSYLTSPLLISIIPTQRVN